MASTLPGVIAPVLGSAVIVLASVVGQTASGYRGIFALATIFLILGAFLVLKVRESRGRSNALLSRTDKTETTETTENAAKAGDSSRNASEVA
jgi:hypothetical protein